MVLFRDPAREIRKKSEREILRVIRYAVNNRRSWVLDTMHSGFCAALNSIHGCGVDRSMEFLRKEMDSRDVKTTPPAGFKSWPVTAKQLKRFIERHSGHRYPETMILTVAKAKGVPIKRQSKKRSKAAKKIAPAA
jgi:hypothetical protein